MKTLRRIIAVAAIVAATLTFTSVESANAATPSPTLAVYSASLPTLFPRIEWHWQGITLHYTKAQTQMIAAGVAAAGGVWIGGVYAGAIALGMSQAWASAAVDQGNCLKLDIPWSIGVSVVNARPAIERC